LSPPEYAQQKETEKKMEWSLSSQFVMRRQMPPLLKVTLASPSLVIFVQHHLENGHNATTMSKNSTKPTECTPVLLLKTKSIPNDGYEEQFSTGNDVGSFDPIFVPVLEHKFLETGLNAVKDLLQRNRFRRDAGAKYGGLIFTSQRAVEAFSKLVEEGKGADHHPFSDFSNV
jgi:hypothetical protein